ncbi:MAG: signal peptide peptidase SppA, partial [Cyanobacteria bacterium J06598_3]
ALQKYGVGVQAVRVGRYKSAVETFTRSSSSPESKQQTEALVGDLWKDFIQTVSSDRDFTPQQLQTLADEVALVESDQALESGLVDQLGYYGDVLAELKTLAGVEDEESQPAFDEMAGFEKADDFPQTSLVAYANLVARKSMQGRQPDETVAIVYAEGNIVVGSDNFTSGAITSGGLSSTLRAMRKDEDIKAVVLRVNSPGGSALASEVIADEVKQLAAEKPVIVSMGDYAASGGYMIAAPGVKILASPNTITGSIGVYSLLLNFQEIANKNGVTWDVVKTAKFADMQTASRPQNEEELSIQQGYTDSLYDRFTSIVAEGREVSKERVNQVAQGRVWTGEDAIAANLVDELGGLQDAIALAAETAGIDEYQVNEFPKLPSFEEQLLNSFFGSGLVKLSSHLPWQKDPLMEKLLAVREELTLLDTLNDPNNAYMRLPFSTEIE